MPESINKFIKSTETPFYIFIEKDFVDNYKNLEGLFQSIYPNYHISYSYKTNYTPYICNLVKKLGGYAEVVSDMEYELAKRLGYSNKMIVYNGPSKGPKMFEHLEKGGILNIDSYDEACKVVDYCRSHEDNSYKCGLRINLNLSDSFISRFGLEDGSKDFNEAISLIKSIPNLTLVGLHCHISRCRSKEAWAERVKIMISMADKYMEVIPEYISLGSGMYADMPDFLRNQFGGDSVPTFQDYAESTIKPFAKRYGKCDNLPILFTEPGTTLVSRYIEFVTKVLSIKTIRGRNIANMDGSYHNLGEICTLKKLQTKVISGGRKPFENSKIDIMGYTCLEQDLMYEGFDKSLAVDDIIVFENAGGYSIVEKPQFIKPQCPMYALRPDGSIVQIMRAETFDDIFSKFLFES